MRRSFMVFLMLLLGKNTFQFVESVCMLSDRVYKDGETWNPVLQNVVSVCVNCTCESGEIKCSKEQCPTPTCSEPRILHNVCCPFCEVKPDDSWENENGGTLECEFDGKTYASGEAFTSNSTGIRKREENQCVNCVCTSGKVLCHLKTCNIPRKCKKWLNTSDSCCPVCADDRNASLGAIDTTNSAQHNNTTENDCTDTEGVLHRNGSEWRPAVSNCVTCSCLNGDIDCKKVRCPAVDSLRCKTPRRRGSDCCKSCRKKERNRKKVCLSTMRRRSKRRNKNRNGRRRNRKRDRKNKNGNTPDIAILPPLRENVNIVNLTVPDFFTEMCMSKKANHIVYRHVEGRHVFVAFEDVKAIEVEVWRWILKKRACAEGQTPSSRCKAKSADIRLSTLETFTYPADQFRKQITKGMILGATTNKQVRSFKRKLTRSMKKCNSKGKCRVKNVTRAFKNIRLHRISYNCNCKRS